MYKSLTLLLLVLPLTFSNAATSATTYVYTGGPFVTHASAPYAASNFISGSFTVAAPLAGNMPLTDIRPQLVSYSFTDGVNTLNNTNSVVCVTGFYGFKVRTDPGGGIADWAISLCTVASASGPVDLIQSLHNINTDTDDIAVDAGTCNAVNADGCSSVNTNGRYGERYNGAGIWVQQQAATQNVPVPTLAESAMTLLSILLALGAVFALRRQRR